MFNKNKNKIHLTEDEKLIIIRSLNKYSNELKNLICNRPETSNDELLYICLDSYHHLVDCVKRKLEKKNK